MITDRLDLGGMYRQSRYYKLKCKIRAAGFIFSESPSSGRIQPSCAPVEAEHFFVLVVAQSKQQFC